MPLSRRRFLQAGGIGLLAPLGLHPARAAEDNAAWFRNPLRLPEVDAGRMIGDQRVFDLVLQAGGSAFLPGRSTPTVGINGSYLGPVIRAQRGDSVRFNVYNGLGEPSTLHWHGFNLPAAMDGGPHQVIQPGATWRPEFDIRQAASTQWYHSHMYHRTGIQVYHGLAGLFYVDDPEVDGLGLPRDYGSDDIPIILQDRTFNPDNSLRYSASMHDRMVGMMGQTMLVNGTTFPYLLLRQRLTRLRLLNGSNARIYNLEFDDRREFHQIATDGGLLERPVPMRNLILAPGERAEILVEFVPGEDRLLNHRPLPRRTTGGGMGMMGNMMAMNDQPYSIMRFDARRVTGKALPLPAQLVKPRNWSAAEAARSRQLRLEMGMGMAMMQGGGMRINGRSMDPGRIDFRVPLGDVEIWNIVNDSPMAHPLHIHDTQFRILDRDGTPPGEHELGLKDTVLVYPRERVRVITRFETHADPNLPYMFHCHILEHEDAGMMGQFTVEA